MRWVRVSDGRGAAARPSLVSLALIALAVCALLAACAPAAPASQAPGPYYPILRTPVDNTSPTPEPTTYGVGAWPSDSTPGTSGTVVIYVSFRNGGVPVAGASVTMDVQFPHAWSSYGPALTDAGGYAALRVSYTDPLAGQPVRVIVHAAYQGQTYDTTTSFTPT